MKCISLYFDCRRRYAFTREEYGYILCDIMDIFGKPFMFYYAILCGYKVLKTFKVKF